KTCALQILNLELVKMNLRWKLRLIPIDNKEGMTMKLNKILPILFIIMFLVMVGFGIIIPVLPFYAEELGASATELGLLMAVYSLIQVIFVAMWVVISYLICM